MGLAEFTKVLSRLARCRESSAVIVEFENLTGKPRGEIQLAVKATVKPTWKTGRTSTP